MRKLLLLLIVCLFLSSAGTALTDYAVTLEREVDEQTFEELEIGGSYDIDFEDRLLTIEMSYRINLANDSFSRTDFDDFKVTMMAPGSEPVTSMTVDGVSVRQGEETYIPWKTMKTETSVLELDYLLFEVNHTPTDTNGNRLGKRKVAGRIATPRVLVNPQIEAFGTNATEVMRGDTIYVNGSVDDIGMLNLSWNASSQGHELTLRDNAFGQWVPIPEDVETGEQELPLTLTTGRGQLFPRTVRLTVHNRPPDVSLQHADRIVEGADFPLVVKANDDTGVDDVTVTFQGETFAPDDGTVSLPTAELDPGTYAFTVDVTDTAGKQTSAEGQVVIVTEQEAFNDNSIDTQLGQEDTGGKEYSENTSFLISIVNSVRGFFEDLLFG